MASEPRRDLKAIKALATVAHGSNAGHDDGDKHFEFAVKFLDHLKWRLLCLSPDFYLDHLCISNASLAGTAD